MPLLVSLIYKCIQIYLKHLADLELLSIIKGEALSEKSGFQGMVDFGREPGF
jgi:hypothetical protein